MCHHFETATGLGDEEFEELLEFHSKDELEEELSAVFRKRETDVWVTLLADKHGLPVGPVYSVEEALTNEQIEARGTVGETEHPVAGTIPVLEHPLNFERAPSGFGDAAPPLLGEDTETILAEAGYDAEDIERLKRDGAIPDVN